MDVQVHNELHEGQVELFDFEFWPVEHPSEPPDEDHPLKCPMPDSSVINVSICGLLLSVSFGYVFNIWW